MDANGLVECHCVMLNDRKRVMIQRVYGRKRFLGQRPIRNVIPVVFNSRLKGMRDGQIVDSVIQNVAIELRGGVDE